MKALTAFLISVALAAPATAQQAVKYGRLKVTPIDAERFVVSGVPRQVPADYWCAAGTYAQQALRRGFNERIYVVGDYQRGQRTVTFSMSPAGTAAASGPVVGVSVNVDGTNRDVGAARFECFGLKRRQD